MIQCSTHPVIYPSYVCGGGVVHGETERHRNRSGEKNRRELNAHSESSIITITIITTYLYLVAKPVCRAPHHIHAQVLIVSVIITMTA